MITSGFSRTLLIGVLCLGVAGCGTSSLDDLRSELDAIKKKPRGKIESPPEPVVMPTFTYAAHQLRSPFAPPVDVQQVNISSGKKVEPDLSRPLEYLEHYNLEALHMRGNLDWAKSGKVQQAIVEDGDGQQHLVKVGNYMGKNHGRIVEITPNQISIVEIVPDGRDGWVERPRTLTMND